MDIVSIIQQFGFPITLCVVLLLAIRQQNGTLVKAFTDRIRTLENIVKEQGIKIAELEQDRIRRADEYGHTLKDVAVRYASVIRDHDTVIRETLGVLRRLTDAVTTRPCMVDAFADFAPSKWAKASKLPTSADLPADPSKLETDRFHNGG